MTNYSEINLDKRELAVILKFEQNIEHIFSSDTKVILKSSDSDFIPLAIEIDSNFSLPEIISLLKLPIGLKYRAAKFSKTILLFKKAINNLDRALDLKFDINEISIYFKNTSIIIHSIKKNSIVDEFDFISDAIIHHYEYYGTLMGEVPNEIHIPIIEDTATDELFNITNIKKPLNNKSLYGGFWGLYFDSINTPMIYNLNRTSITPGDLDLLI